MQAPTYDQLTIRQCLTRVRDKLRSQQMPGDADIRLLVACYKDDLTWEDFSTPQTPHTPYLPNNFVSRLTNYIHQIQDKSVRLQCCKLIHAYIGMESKPPLAIETARAMMTGFQDLDLHAADSRRTYCEIACWLSKRGDLIAQGDLAEKVERDIEALKTEGQAAQFRLARLIADDAAPSSPLFESLLRQTNEIFQTLDLQGTVEKVTYCDFVGWLSQHADVIGQQALATKVERDIEAMPTPRIIDGIPAVKYLYQKVKGDIIESAMIKLGASELINADLSSPQARECFSRTACWLSKLGNLIKQDNLEAIVVARLDKHDVIQEVRDEIRTMIDNHAAHNTPLATTMRQRTQPSASGEFTSAGLPNGPSGMN